MNPNAPTIGLGPDARPVGYHRLHRDRSIEFQANRLLQWVGIEELPRIREAMGRVTTYADWIAEFAALADSAHASGRALCAAYYNRAAEFFMAPDDPRREVARTRFVTGMRELYQLQPIQIPYEGAKLPAYDIHPDGSPRGTIVITGGFDEYVEETFPLLQAGTRAGYRIVAFDGPGQGGALEDHGLTLTPAWERPVAAVLDHFALDDVTLIGISLGGGLAIRAAAFEPRIKRVVALDVLDDFLECLGRQSFPGATSALRVLLTLRARALVNLAVRVVAARKPVAQWGVRHGMRVTGTRDPYGFMQAASALTTRNLTAVTGADVLLLAGAADHYIPASQLARQAAALTAARAAGAAPAASAPRSITTRVFTAAEQAHNHCQIGNLGLCLTTILDWLASLAGSPAESPDELQESPPQRRPS